MKLVHTLSDYRFHHRPKTSKESKLMGEISNAVTDEEVLAVEHSTLKVPCETLAQIARHSQAMVERGYENARRNGLENLEFHAWDLSQDISGQAWARQAYDRILIDPPRTGALEMVKLMPRLGASRIVYVSCNPATLARDAGELMALGYRLKAAGVMDMFPHTTHVESIAVFEKAKKK